MLTRVRSLLLALPLLLCSARALAGATVVVELKHPDGTPAEGTVLLTKGETKHQCTTDKSGRCAITGVAGGSYVVAVVQEGRPSPKEKKVMIPPSGEVKLIVNAP